MWAYVEVEQVQMQQQVQDSTDHPLSGQAALEGLCTLVAEVQEWSL